MLDHAMIRRALGLCCLAAACAGAALAPNLSAGGQAGKTESNWPRFRGPNGTGVAADKLPVQWQGENILWKTPLPGDGNSSPVVWGGKVFLQSADPKGSDRSLLCLDAATGKVLWEKSVQGKTSGKHQKNSFASSTPATDGERVYVSIWTGGGILLAAYDFAGQEVWTRDLGGFESQHGAGASPIAYDGKVYYVYYQDFKCKVYALDGKTGKTVWEKDRPAFRACYGAPFVWEKADGAKELVVTSTLAFTGYNPETGDVNWQWAWKHFAARPLRVVGSPAYHGNTIFVCSGDGGGDRYAVAVQVIADKDRVIPTEIWSNKKDFPYVPTVLSYGDNVYFVHDRGVAACYSARTGQKIHEQRLPDATFTASPVIAGGKMYAPTEEGDVYVLTADENLQVLARNELGELIRATPAVADGRLYVRGKDHLFCIGAKE